MVDGENESIHVPEAISPALRMAALADKEAARWGTRMTDDAEGQLNVLKVRGEKFRAEQVAVAERGRSQLSRIAKVAGEHLRGHGLPGTELVTYMWLQNMQVAAFQGEQLIKLNPNHPDLARIEEQIQSWGIEPAHVSRVLRDASTLLVEYRGKYPAGTRLIDGLGNLARMVGIDEPDTLVLRTAAAVNSEPRHLSGSISDS